MSIDLDKTPVPAGEPDPKDVYRRLARLERKFDELHRQVAEFSKETADEIKGIDERMDGLRSELDVARSEFAELRVEFSELRKLAENNNLLWQGVDRKLDKLTDKITALLERQS